MFAICIYAHVCVRASGTIYNPLDRYLQGTYCKYKAFFVTMNFSSHTLQFILFTNENVPQILVGINEAYQEFLKKESV